MLWAACLPVGTAGWAARPAVVHQDQGEASKTTKGPREVVLSLKGGREVSGVFVREDASTIYLQIEGIETGFEKSSVKDIRELPPVLERFAVMRSLIADDDLEGRVLLAEWLRARALYRVALDEVNGVLEQDPHHPRALELKTWLELQIRLEHSQVPSELPGGATPDAKRAFLERQKAKNEFPMLTPDQINLIKVYEVDLRDPPGLLIKRETIDQLIRMFPQSPYIPATPEGREALYRKPPEQILELMFRLQARELYGQVIVRGHPAAMERFRNEVHGKWLLNSCATTQCHGGIDAGRLWLQDRKPFSDETVYTNFLILERFRLKDGTPLLNYSEPARSPLLQMGLPEELSLYPHPRVPATRGSRGWRPIFKSSEDRRFQEAVGWLSSMYRPRPNYPIEYEPPVPPRPGAGQATEEQQETEPDR
ncbi:MAG: hypothetical protein Kow0022_07820 [Phycisphaerales bacterium]